MSPLTQAQGMIEGTSVLTAMTTPAVLLLANAMLILSTIQRLQAILTRVDEDRDRIERVGTGAATPAQPERYRQELEMHAYRLRLAHRALFAFYTSAASLLLMIFALGLGAAGWSRGMTTSLVAAFLGAGLLLLGTGLLTAETWVGVRATDHRLTTVLTLCSAPPPSDETAGGSTTSPNLPRTP